MSDNITNETTKEILKESVKDISNNIVKPTTEILGLVPRAIKAAFSPLEKWIISREYNIEETKKLLGKKLENINPENIVSPEPHIAVPALQYISYCTDNNELRNLYANLLASSMNKIVKNDVHPSFVEIIKQLSPDEAKILKYIASNKKTSYPMIGIRLITGGATATFQDVVTNFSNIGELSHCEYPLNIRMYLDNMSRLGLFSVCNDDFQELSDSNLYKSLEGHIYITKTNEEIKKEIRPDGRFRDFTNTEFHKGFFEITDFGKLFCKVCISQD